MKKKHPSMKEIAKRLQQRKTSLETQVKKATTAIQKREATKKSLDWFFNTIKASKDDYKYGSFSIMEHPFIGGMFHQVYDPKHKATLPYYDKFPLIIPINIYNDGFLALNLHYLPPILRAKLLDQLIENYKKGVNAKTYMAISYPILKAASEMKMFEPCLHRYLTDHIRSKIVMVTADLWEEVAFLPTQQFVGATHQEVWADSKRRATR